MPRETGFDEASVQSILPRDAAIAVNFILLLLTIGWTSPARQRPCSLGTGGITKDEDIYIALSVSVAERSMEGGYMIMPAATCDALHVALINPE